MEMSRGNIVFVQRLWRSIIVLLLMLPLYVAAQNTQPQYVIDNGNMVIRINKSITDSALRNFVRNFNLFDLDLEDFIKKNVDDSLHKQGWSVEILKNGNIIITKRLNALKSVLKEKPEKKEQPEKRERPEIIEAPGWLQVLINFGNISDKEAVSQSGGNRFVNKRPFRTHDSVVTFYLRGRLNAREVFLAGSFTDWQNDKLDMQRTDSGWIANVKLGPGKYFYKFIVDNNWTIDNDNILVENDGNGNDNSVYYRPNQTFTLAGHTDAKKVFLAGSFNKWASEEIAMERTLTGWQVSIYLAPGTYTYRYVVDGNWMIDPGNKQKVPNEFNDYNSFIAVGNSYTFRLAGYPNAKNVVLAGTFNNWQPNELHMLKTATDWELPYALGPGNYEYKFVVDGIWMTDPANPITVMQEGNRNSYMIIAPNYTFRLKGFANAKAVYLAGDFNEWSANSLKMFREGDEWVYSVYLSPGKHLYKFVVDGNWMRDPDNTLWDDNGGTGNSIIWQVQ